jgi:GAF domain-containing protein
VLAMSENTDIIDYTPLYKKRGHHDWHDEAMKRLDDVEVALSLADSLASITAVVREAARYITGADGATFVLRDGECCHYVDESAIHPLWKGSRFSMSLCISGWVMMNAQQVVIEDIYQDPRIPAIAYKPTFVKSMAMVPMPEKNPVGAIGNYWASLHRPTDEEMDILQSLANIAARAMERLGVPKH